MINKLCDIYWQKPKWGLTFGKPNWFWIFLKTNYFVLRGRFVENGPKIAIFTPKTELCYKALYSTGVKNNTNRRVIPCTSLFIADSLFGIRFFSRGFLIQYSQEYFRTLVHFCYQVSTVLHLLCISFDFLCKHYTAIKPFLEPDHTYTIL